jgi:murein DD-endopeptidase MepM/ murein hydrolase activator NlpD
MKLLFLIIFITFLSGCATAPPKTASMYPLTQPLKDGVYHRVSRGQTLWRIAKAYNVDISRIATANRLQDPTKIEVGQMLFVPTAKQKKEIIAPIRIEKVGKAGFIWPVKGKVVSYFGQKKHNVVNDGIDIVSAKNSTVVASKAGVISFCDDKVKGFGKIVIIEHDDGYCTVYAYNSENLVKAGERVRRGQQIAKIGKSARSDKHTLHFEIRKKEKPKNPFYYLP